MKSTYDETITRRLFFSMVPVQILLVMCGGVNVIIDSAFASNLIGPDAMAVTGLYGPLAKVLDTINALIFCGAQILCGKFLGENTLKRAKSVFTLDMIVMTIIGLLFSVMFLFTPSLMAGFCTKPGNSLTPGLIEYLKGLGIGVVPFLLGTQLTSFLQLEKKEKLGYVGIGAMFAANTICDFLFIKVFDMGLYGLGLATALSNWVSFIVPAIYFLSGKAVFSISFVGLRIKDLFDIIRSGAPAAGTQLMLVFRGLILNNLILTFAGSDGMAAFTAVGSFGYVYWSVSAGMSSALVTLASVYTGEKDRSALEVLLKLFLSRALLIVTGVSLLLSALSYPLTNMFFHDPSSAVYSMTFMGFLLFPLSTPLSLITVGLRDMWRCMDYKFAVNAIVLFDGIISVTTMSFIMSNLYGMLGIWLGQVMGGVLTCLVIFFLACAHERKIPTSCADLCCFRPGFGVDDDRRLTISIHSMEEVINVSEKVINFCESHGIDKIRSFRAGLCVEELAGNIVKHGFTNKKNSVADVCLIITGEELAIRFKDNCHLFNPAEVEAIFVPEDPCKNGSIRLVRKTCKEMEYHTLLGLNVMSIVM